MAVLSVKELFCRRKCVFLQSVSAFLQLIVAKIHFQLSLFLSILFVADPLFQDSLGEASVWQLS